MVFVGHYSLLDPDAFTRKEPNNIHSFWLTKKQEIWLGEVAIFSLSPKSELAKRINEISLSKFGSELGEQKRERNEQQN